MKAPRAMQQRLAAPRAWLACLAALAALQACSGDESGEAPGSATPDTAAVGAAGREKSIPCLACHGAVGISDYDVWPDLAGQHEPYLAKQLRDFRDGRRYDPWMSPMALNLSDRDIEDLAEYFSSLPGVAGGPAAAPREAATCVACHSENAGEANPLWPALAGQNERYLAKQLRDYREGRRQDPVMAPLAMPLSDEDIAAVAAYFANL